VVAQAPHRLYLSDSTDLLRVDHGKRVISEYLFDNRVR
jgi:hypothetical protein